jgi:hypothetical protein
VCISRTIYSAKIETDRPEAFPGFYFFNQAYYLSGQVIPAENEE